MAVNLQQTDTAPDCGVAAFCSGRGVSVTTPLDAQASLGGSAGSSEDLPAIGNTEANVVVYSYECLIPAGYQDATGNWTININVSTGNTDVEFNEVHICRVNSLCASQETVGSVTGFTDSVSAGSHPYIIDQPSSVTWAAGDSAQVVIVATNVGKGSKTFGITPSLIHVAPGTVEAGTYVSPGMLYKYYQNTVIF